MNVKRRQRMEAGNELGDISDVIIIGMEPFFGGVVEAGVIQLFAAGAGRDIDDPIGLCVRLAVERGI